MNRPSRACQRCKTRHNNTGVYCDACMERKQTAAKDRVRRYDLERGKTTARGYGADWRKVRTAKLAMTPLCECDRCRKMGRVLVADTVHHIKTVERRPDLRLSASNLKSMSQRCHEAEHGREKDFDYLEWQRRGV